MIPRTDETYYNTIVANQQGTIMIPLTQITWRYIDRSDPSDRRGRKTKTIYLNAIHIFRIEEEEHGTRVCYAIHGDVLVEESPEQISAMMLRVHQTRNAPTNY